MLHKFLWWKLETGCLVFACASTFYSLLVFIYGICVYEDFEHMSEAWVLRIFKDDVSENAVRISFILVSILDIASSALLVYGIVKVNKNDLNNRKNGFDDVYFPYCLQNNSQVRKGAQFRTFFLIQKTIAEKTSYALHKTIE